MLGLDASVGVGVVQRHTALQCDRHKVPEHRLRLTKSKDLRKEFSRRLLVRGINNGVVERDGNGALRFRRPD